MNAAADIVRVPVKLTGELRDVLDLVKGEAPRLRGYSGGVRYGVEALETGINRSCWSEVLGDDCAREA